MSINRRTFLAAGATALILSITALPAQAMPGPDDTMESWPEKLKQVANPADISRVQAGDTFTNQQLKFIEPEPDPWKHTNPEPTPWKFREQVK